MVVIITVSVPLSTLILSGSAKNETPQVTQLQIVKIKGKMLLAFIYFNYYLKY